MFTYFMHIYFKQFVRNLEELGFVSLCAIRQIDTGWKASLLKDAWLNQEVLHFESPLLKRHFACQSDGAQLSKALSKVALLWNTTFTAWQCTVTISV